MPGHPVIGVVAGPVGSGLQNTVTNNNCCGGGGFRWGMRVCNEKSWGCKV